VPSEKKYLGILTNQNYIIHMCLDDWYR